MSRWLRLRANSAPKDPDSGRPLVEPTSANSPARGFGYGPQLTVPRAPLPGSHPSTATAAAAVAAVSLGTGPAAPRAPSSSPHRRQRNAERDHRDFQHHHRERHLRNTPRDSRDPRPRKPNLSNLPNPHQPSSDRNLAPPPINRSHLRSASQPFPALVDGRHGLNNNVDVPIGRQGYLDHDINVAYFSPVSRPPPPSVPPKTGSAPRAPGGHGVPDGQIIRKCMTCGHHNSFPGGNKGFGCSSCGMINNLEPNRDKTVPGPAGAVKQLAFPGVFPVSVERTQEIIDQCMDSYLRPFLMAPNLPPSSNAPPPVRGSPMEPRHRRSRSHNSVRMSWEHLSPMVAEDPDGRKLSGEMPPSDREVSPNRTFPRPGCTPPRKVPPRGKLPDHSALIFRQLIGYIQAAFNGCDTINCTFLTPRPPPDFHESGHGRLRNADSGILVTAKSPRIDWPKVARWYDMIINVGDSWINKWSGMKPDPSLGPREAAQERLWASVNVAVLDKEISDARQHVRDTLLRSTEQLLLRPRRPLKGPDDIRFLLVLLANPLLRGPQSGRSGKKGKAAEREDTLNRDLVAKIMKRNLGLIAGLPSDCHQTLASWFSRFPKDLVGQLVELVGRFIAYRLAKGHKRRRPRKVNLEPDLDEFVPTLSASGATPGQLHDAISRVNKTKADDEANLGYMDDWQVKAAARVMSFLYAANASHRHQSHRALPINQFYSSILDYWNLIPDFEAWESRREQFTFCQFSFMLSVFAKIRILEFDAQRQMKEKAREAFYNSVLAGKTVSQYMVLRVRRECLVEDSLTSVSEVVATGVNEIKKKLRIEFVGEEGVDAGGLRKEWFLLLTRDIFDPMHGLFIYDDESGYCYFNPHCLESSQQFFLVGVLLGLAIYNSTILDIALPPFAFRKLMASMPASMRRAPLPQQSVPPVPYRASLDDLGELRPTLARGLRQLLAYDGDDVESVFCLDFVAPTERYGQQVHVPLCPGGERRAVTASNRREYVELLVRYHLDGAVARQFEPLRNGFFSVCGGNALHLFAPEEIEMLVRGASTDDAEPLDVDALRAVAVYRGWDAAAEAAANGMGDDSKVAATANTQYSIPESEPVVQWFWHLLETASPANQRRILTFITGSDRLPATGAAGVVMQVACLGPDEGRYPTARTCFNMVGLYRYRSRKRFERVFWEAVVGSEGFGLK